MNSKDRRAFFDRHILITVLAAAAMMIMIGATLLSYFNYLVRQQQKEFLQLAHAVRYGIEICLEGEKRSLLEYDFSDGGSKESLQAYLALFPESRKLGLVTDAEGTILLQCPAGDGDSVPGPLKEEISGLAHSFGQMNEKEILQGRALKISDHAYGIPFVRRLDRGRFVIELMGLEEIRTYLNSCMEDQNRGYAALKTQDGYIISHPNQNQIGLHMTEGRKEKYPDLDLSYLEELEERQLSGEEDTAVYDSYWFNEEPVRRSRKIATFTPVPLENEFWVLTLNLDYGTYMAPLRGYVMITLFLTAVLLIFSAAMLILRRAAREREKLALLETVHVKELNESHELYLRERDKRLQAIRLSQIGAMASRIAHDFRNFLHPVIGSAEFIYDSEEASEQIRQDAEQILNYSEKAVELTRQLSRLGRGETLEMALERLDLTALVKGCEEGIRRILPNNVKMESHAGGEKLTVLANALRLEETVWNLCGNAIDAMKEKGGTLSIRLSRIPAAELPSSASVRHSAFYALLEIEDTGTGMDRETLDRIFLQFFTTKKADEGTGLGLAIVYNTVTSLGGDVLVSSEKGKGTVFRCLIPEAEEET